MSLYICNTSKGVIPEFAKSKIASDITNIHCQITGEASLFVNVFYFDDAPRQAINGKQVFLYGNIRSGRSQLQKDSLISQIKNSIHTHTAIPMDEIIVDTTEIPAHWVMQGNEILPDLEINRSG